MFATVVHEHFFLKENFDFICSIIPLMKSFDDEVVPSSFDVILTFN